MAQQIQIRRDTAANWSTVNPVLAQGEPGYVIGTGQQKIGDGITAWNALAIAGGSGSYTLPPATTTTLGGVIVGANLTVGIDGTLSAPTPITSLPYGSITGTPTIPAAQVNSDWNASAGLAQILNKPAIPAAYTLPIATATTLGGVKQGANVAIAGDGTLSVAAPVTSLPYGAITGAPTIPAAQVNSDWNAVSGVAQILNRPTIPAAYSLPTASSTVLGGVTVGANLSIAAGVLAAVVGLGANTFAAAQTLPAGTITAPSLTFANATSGKTGLFSANADDIAFASNGVRVLWHQSAHTNLGIGANSLAGLTSGTGAYNIALGYYSMGFANVSGSYNIAAGFEALVNGSSTSYQIALGGYALAAISTSAYQHIAIGWQAGTALTNSAVNNVLIGHQAGKALTTGGNNVVIGASSALTTSLKASQCIAIGNSALTAYNDGDTTYNCNSVAIGFGAMASLTNGYENVAVGTSILTSATSSYWCTGLGIQALQNATTGARLTGIGLSALSLATTSIGASGLGMNAGIGGGNAALAVTTASYGTYLGYQAGPSTATQRDYQTVIGANATGYDAGNSITLGRIGTDTVYMGAAVIGASAVSGVGYTVATLPAAAAALKGARAFVTDATSPSWLSSLTGGGSIACPVFCNGSAWVAG